MDTYVVGKCSTMCPVEEMKMRQREKLLHTFEMVPGTEKRQPLVDPERAVKMYNRSAAGKFMTNENYLRPPQVLMKTVHYLLAKVAQDKNSSWLTKYDFISDRLRAIRQDMIIQNLSQENAITLLEPMVRFHAYSAYWLCNQDIYHFDPHLNKKTLQECLNYLLVLYTQVERNEIKFDERFLTHVNDSRPFFEALNLILNLGNEEVLLRVVSLPKKWRTPLLRGVILLGINYTRKNFVRLFRSIQDLTPLLAGVCILHLPMLRRQTYQIMSVAYSSKNLRFPLSKLKQLLMYETDKDVVEDCSHYGLETDGNTVQFGNKSIKNSDKEIHPKKMLFLEEYFKNITVSTFLMPEEDPPVELLSKLKL